MKDDFFKFPSTPHLTILGDLEIRNDKVMSESDREEFFHHELIVEEKVDGSNLGISFDSNGNIRAQNRGQYLDLPAVGQWKKLDDWLSKRVDDLFEHLTDRYILFGEWCYAQHSVYYNRLPDWFVGFDIYDRKIERFLATQCRNALFKATNVFYVPTIARGFFTLQEIKKMMSISRFGDQPAEGLYLRVEMDCWLVERAKLVRPAFIQSIDKHWAFSGIKPNKLLIETWDQGK